MLELKDYTKPELTAIFGTKDMEGLKRKLSGYKIKFEVKGKGENAVFTIKEIADPFKIYCITELGFDSRTDFKKLRNFYNYYFNDEEFMAMPDEVKEFRMEKQRQNVSRQTIAKYTEKLVDKDLIYKNTSEYIYYFAFKNKQILTKKETYLQAWREYWEDIEKSDYSAEAIIKMIGKYGGVAKKQAKPEINGIYKAEIDYLNTLIQQSIEEEIKSMI